jgi:mono/diheme cytochrome c family protein
MLRSVCAAFATVFVCAAIALSLRAAPPEPATGPLAQQTFDEPQVRAFLKSNCIRCHSGDTPKGDRRLDTLGSDLTNLDTLALWQDVVDQLNLGTMPPPEAKQPAAPDRQAVVDWITARLAAAHAQQKSTGGETVLRRLNRVQYDNTVRDLLALRPMLAEPTESFPPDETIEDFDNIGSTLVMSDFLLQSYVAAAETLITEATHDGPQPEVRKYHFDAPFCPTGNRHDGLDRPGQYQHIRKNTADEGGHLWLARFKEGAPHSGWYTFRFKAQAVHRNYPYSERIVGVPKDEPLRTRIVVGSAAYGDLEKRTGSDRERDEFVLPDDAPQWFETRLWLDEGYQPRLTFPNGPIGVKPLRKQLVNAYTDTFPRFIKYLDPNDPSNYPPSLLEEALRKQKQIAAADEPVRDGELTTRGTSRRMNSTEGWSTFFSEYEGPRVRVFEMELEGPFYDSWPPPSHVALYGDLEPTEANARPILERFATRAFRRPVTPDELNVLVALVEGRRKLGDEPRLAIEAGLKAVLCSPAFVYLDEGSEALDDYALASRLSYFLWSSMPDDELLALAAQGKLRDPAVREQQARRMLGDSRSEAFVEQFTSRWLELYKIGSMPPDPSRFRPYYNDVLEPAMKRETQLFFAHLLRENLPIGQFLDADFTFVNGSLARLYGIDGIVGSEFQRVSLTDDRRGGLLGQASILTASANGIDTSPVIRGIWVLKNILGTPPAPPPPDVEPLEPDIRGATTIRDQLAKHRTVATCNECHRKIDPLGFALENFDPIGRWRDNYPRGGNDDGPAIDPSGQLPDGRAFADIAELKGILQTRGDQFARCLTEKLLAYALGRLPEPTDRPVVDGIVGDLHDRGDGLQDLVVLLVRSEAFGEK